ncbi:MAG: ABC transporter ATP-binding protein [Armatimonadota bacterium]|nr:ABC transporter ATP-binding protein [Armatimonadota bacterium]
MAQAVVQVRGVSLRLGEFAVHDADLEVRQGEYFVLLGPTGAGKTVVLECVAGLHRPDRGDVYVDGERVNEAPPELRGLGYLPQDYALFPHLTVAQNIGFGMRVQRKPRAEIERRVQELAALLGVTHLLRRSPAKLSGGEQQRVALARAVAIQPKVLLLDEPLSALDEQTREVLCVELRRVHEELGTTTLHVSHNFEETLAVADRIGIIHQGRMRQVGTPEEVFRRPNSEFVARFVRSENILRGRARAGGSGLMVRVGEVELEAVEGPEGEVFLTVRPEEVALTPAPGEARPNRIVGRVARVVDKGALMRVEVEAGVTLVALVGRRAFQGSGLGAGSEVAVSFDPAAAHVFAAE